MSFDVTMRRAEEGLPWPESPLVDRVWQEGMVWAEPLRRWRICPVDWLPLFQIGEDGRAAASEEEWAQAGWLEDWLTELYRKSVQHVREEEAFSAFGEELYPLLLERAHEDRFAAMLGRLKRFKSEDRLDIARAKAYPVEELAQRLGMEARMGFCRCPFHDDSTASLKLFARTNTWKCFGCQAGGDAIDLATRSGMGFREAVRMMGG